MFTILVAHRCRVDRYRPLNMAHIGKLNSKRHYFYISNFDLNLSESSSLQLNQCAEITTDSGRFPFYITKVYPEPDVEEPDAEKILSASHLSSSDGRVCNVLYSCHVFNHRTLVCFRNNIKHARPSYCIKLKRLPDSPAK